MELTPVFPFPCFDGRTEKDVILQVRFYIILKVKMCHSRWFKAFEDTFGSILSHMFIISLKVAHQTIVHYYTLSTSFDKKKKYHVNKQCSIMIFEINNKSESERGITAKKASVHRTGNED